MKHIFLIDSLDKLVVNKDSSLLLALTAQQLGYECYLLFVENLYFSNQSKFSLKVCSFTGNLEKEVFYLKNFEIDQEHIIELVEGDTIYMRLDPPFNLSYLHTLWLLQALENKGVVIKNSPLGIAGLNEKLSAYSRDQKIPTWVGVDEDSAIKFIQSLLVDKVESEFIFKPLDLFQGIGVDKVLLHSADENRMREFFVKKQQEFKGAVVIQPFVRAVAQGEIRSIFFNAREAGSILKIPPQGEFLANIAQGASYEPITLSREVEMQCESIAKEFLKKGISFIAFDILDGAVSEINITCPGLLVEVSNAHHRNLALDFFN